MDGNGVGAALGPSLGWPEATMVGRSEGLGDGMALRGTLSLLLGAEEGTGDGTVDGPVDGLKLGCLMRDWVGSVLG